MTLNRAKIEQMVDEEHPQVESMLRDALEAKAAYESTTRYALASYDQLSRLANLMTGSATHRHSMMLADLSRLVVELHAKPSTEPDQQS